MATIKQKLNGENERANDRPFMYHFCEVVIVEERKRNNKHKLNMMHPLIRFGIAHK